MLKARFLLVAWLAAAMLCSCEKQSSAPPPPVTAGGAKVVPVAAPAAVTDTNVPSMEAAQSVVVTHDLDLGPNPPGLAELLQQIDRRHQPADGAGRTFAILEAFTQSGAPPGKFRLNLRLSTEKPGVGEIMLRRPSETNSLWKSRVTPAAKPPSFSGGQLTILFDAGDGKQFTVDGSMNPASIFEANLKEPGVPVAQAWPDGEERKLKFIYSACGCPIEVKCRRAGDRTVRTEAATQVIFPDDPAAAQLISRLMRW